MGTNRGIICIQIAEGTFKERYFLGGILCKSRGVYFKGEVRVAEVLIIIRRGGYVFVLVFTTVCDDCCSPQFVS